MKFVTHQNTETFSQITKDLTVSIKLAHHVLCNILKRMMKFIANIPNSQVSGDRVTYIVYSAVLNKY